MAGQLIYDHDTRVSIGRTIGRATTCAIRNPLAVLAAWLLVAAVSGGWEALMAPVTLAAQSSSPSVSFGSGVAVLTILGWAVVSAASAVSQAMLIHLTIADHHGDKIGTWEAIVRSIPLILPVIGFSTLWAIGFFLGLLLLVIPGLIVVTAWAVGLPALVAERTGVVEAFGRSRELTTGHRWAVFGLLILVLIISWLAMIPLGLGKLATGISADGSLDPALFALNALAGSFLYVVWGLVGPALFIELRQAHDGGDVQGLEAVFS